MPEVNLVCLHMVSIVFVWAKTVRESKKLTLCSMVWYASPSLPRWKLEPQHSPTIVVPGMISTYTYSFTDPLSAQVGLNILFVLKRAKLQYAIKSSTLLNDDEQCLYGAFSRRCKTVPQLPLWPKKTHAVATNQWGFGVQHRVQATLEGQRMVPYCEQECRP